MQHEMCVPACKETDQIDQRLGPNGCAACILVFFTAYVCMYDWECNTFTFILSQVLHSQDVLSKLVI